MKATRKLITENTVQNYTTTTTETMTTSINLSYWSSDNEQANNLFDKLKFCLNYNLNDRKETDRMKGGFFLE